MEYYQVELNKDKGAGSKDDNSTNMYIKTIEWDMMDKSKFFPLSMLSSFSVRCALYPLTLIKTRLQVQKHNDMYSGKLLQQFWLCLDKENLLF